MANMFSTGLRNAMLGDEGAVKYLEEECYQNYLNGDRSALLSALITCALLQAVIPDWAAVELLDLDGLLEGLDVKDLNHFFGFTPEHSATLNKAFDIKSHHSNVLSALFYHRLAGGNFSAPDGLQALADETGAPRRIVEAIYNTEKPWLQNLPKKPPEGDEHGYVRANFSSLKELRRRGRPILKD